MKHAEYPHDLYPEGGQRVEPKQMLHHLQPQPSGKCVAKPLWSQITVIFSVDFQLDFILIPDGSHLVHLNLVFWGGNTAVQ